MSSSDTRAAPFAFGEADARAAALTWIRARWLASARLSRHAREGPIESVWVPSFLVDARALAHWEAPALRGIVEMDFGALAASAELASDALVEALEPWPAATLRARDACDMQHHAVAHATRGRDDALALARKRMERDVMATARRNQSKAVRDRIRLMSIEFPRETYTPVLLPMWRFDDMRLGRRWRVAVNGVTGKVAGVR